MTWPVSLDKKRETTQVVDLQIVRLCKEGISLDTRLDMAGRPASWCKPGKVTCAVALKAMHARPRGAPYPSQAPQGRSRGTEISTWNALLQWRRAFQLETFGRKYSNFSVCCTWQMGIDFFTQYFHIFSALRQLALVNP